MSLYTNRYKIKETYGQNTILAYSLNFNDKANYSNILFVEFIGMTFGKTGVFSFDTYCALLLTGL